MNRTWRLWIVLWGMFTLTFGVFVRHDIIEPHDGYKFLIFHEASFVETLVLSSIAGLVLSTATIGLHIAVEHVWGTNHATRWQFSLRNLLLALTVIALLLGLIIATTR